MSHLNSIGFKINSAEEFEALVAKVFASGVEVKVDGGSYLVYRDKSGAEIYAQIDATGEFIGFMPSFDATVKRRVHITEAIGYDEATALDRRYLGKSELETYPFIFDVVNAKQRLLTTSSREELVMVAFPHEIEYFPTEEAFLAETPELTTTYFIPVGLMTQEGEATETPEPYAMFVGEIQSVELKTNEFYGGEFYVLELITLEANITVVVAVEMLKSEPKVGGYINGVFWMSAKV